MRERGVPPSCRTIAVASALAGVLAWFVLDWVVGVIETDAGRSPNTVALHWTSVALVSGFAYLSLAASWTGISRSIAARRSREVG